MFSERIRALRMAYRLNQIELAEALHVSKQTISNWENDNIQPSIDMLMKISSYFNVSTDYLLGLDDRTCLEITNLPIETVSHIQQIINDIKKNG